MRKYLSFLLAATISVCFLSGCQTGSSETTHPTESTIQETQATEPTGLFNCDEHLLSALIGEAPIVTQDGRIAFLSEYLMGQYNAAALAYTFVDFDHDTQNEMVIETSSEIATYIVLHFSDSDIFAFPFGVRALNSLKADGSFLGSNGAASTEYLTLRFNGGGYVIVREANADYSQSSFEINGIACSEEQINAFTDDWYAKEDAAWTILENHAAQQVPDDTEQTAQTDVPMEETTAPQQETATPYLETIGRADQSIFDGPSYDHSFVGTVEVAGIYTIVEEAWDAEGNLWGRLKSGAGWVDLTNIRSLEASQMPISANFADDRLISSGNYHHCIADTSEYMVQIALRANEVLTNFSFVSLQFTEYGYEAAELLFSISELTPDKPLVADVAFPGDMSMYGISFTDSNGVIHHYSVSISGRNGTLVLSTY